MNKAIAIFRDGTWLSAARIRRWAIVATVGTVLFVLFLALTANGLSDFMQRPLGTDFSSFYAAGRLVAAGGDPYDPAALHGMQEAIFGAGTPYYAFAYPPIFLLVTWLLAHSREQVVWRHANVMLWLISRHG